MVRSKDFTERIVEFGIFKTLFLVLVVLTVIKATYILLTRFEKVIVVDENMSYGGKGKRMVGNLITDKEDNVYMVQNEPLLLHWSSAEILAQLNQGQTYKVKGYGRRIPILGLYPVITQVLPSTGV